MAKTLRPHDKEWATARIDEMVYDVGQYVEGGVPLQSALDIVSKETTLSATLWEQVVKKATAQAGALYDTDYACARLADALSNAGELDFAFVNQWAHEVMKIAQGTEKLELENAELRAKLAGFEKGRADAIEYVGRQDEKVHSLKQDGFHETAKVHQDRATGATFVLFKIENSIKGGTDEK